MADFDSNESSSGEDDLVSDLDAASSEEISDDDYEASGAKTGSGPGRKKEQEVKNLPYDAALELSASASMGVGALDAAAGGAAEVKNKPHDAEFDMDGSLSGSSVDTNPSPSSSPAKGGVASLGAGDNMKGVGAGGMGGGTKAAGAGGAGDRARSALDSGSESTSDSGSEEESDSDSAFDDDSPAKPAAKPAAAAAAAAVGGATAALAADKKADGKPDAVGDSTATKSGGDGESKAEEGAYNPADYEGLRVGPEVRELFQYIGRYKPHDIELDTSLKCFIPEYIPSVGEIDAFLKIPRPDKKPDELGLRVLDEPAAHQSDATVLDLQMRAVSKRRHGAAKVRSIEQADKNPREVQRWIDSVTKLHKSKPPPQVHYSRTMPDIEQLMQVWPEEMEKLFDQVALPSPDMDLSVKEYAKIVCTLLDIPVHPRDPKAIVQSLHVLFTLFSEFKGNQHFTGIGSAAGVTGK